MSGGGSIIAAGTTVLGNVGGAYFANKAAKENAKSYSKAFEQNQNLVNAAAGRLDPYAASGEQALAPLTGLLLGKSWNPETGEFGNSLSQVDRMNLFQTSPGYQFRINQANKAIENSQAARGNLLSGAALKELTTYNQGLASDEYNNYISQLSGLAGMGQQAATSQAGIQNSAIPGLTNLFLGSQSYPAMKNQNIANAFNSTGNSLATIFGSQQGQSANPAQAASSGGSGLGAFALQNPTMDSSALLAASDINLKENIELVDISNSGIPIYEFDYKNKNFGIGRYRGVIAQDLEKMNPQAVITAEEGYKMVNYSIIDVDFRRIE